VVTLPSTLTMHGTLTKTLNDWGFIVNPYDQWVASNMFDGKQFTVLWHMDDIIISYVSNNVVTRVTDNHSGKYGK